MHTHRQGSAVLAVQARLEVLWQTRTVDKLLVCRHAAQFGCPIPSLQSTGIGSALLDAACAIAVAHDASGSLIVPA